jgi:hypothetical protein
MGLYSGKSGRLGRRDCGEGWGTHHGGQEAHLGGMCPLFLQRIHFLIIFIQKSVEPDLKQFRERWGSDIFRLFNVIGSVNLGSNGNFTTPPEVWGSIRMLKNQFEFLDGAVSIMFGDFLTANGYPTIISQQHEGGVLDVKTTWGYKTWLTSEGTL